MTGSSHHINTNSELCPNCGKYTDYQLNDLTGWCIDCTPAPTSLALTKVELSLSANADAIEYYLSEGRSDGKTLAGNVWKALELARQDRAVCVVCGGRIKRASRTSVFCRQFPECRRISRRYVYLYSERKPPLTKVEALALIFTELGA